MKTSRLALFAIPFLGLMAPSDILAQERVGTSQADLPSLSGVFAIHNHTGVAIRYEVKWGNGSWERFTVEPNKVYKHSYPLDGNGRAPKPYVRFDDIGGDGKTTFKEYYMQFKAVGYAGYGPGPNPTEPENYHFKYGADGRHLDLLKEK